MRGGAEDVGVGVGEGEVVSEAGVNVGMCMKNTDGCDCEGGFMHASHPKNSCGQHVHADLYFLELVDIGLCRIW